jgi:hypothetical protein
VLVSVVTGYYGNVVSWKAVAPAAAFSFGSSRLGSNLETGCTVHETWLDVRFALSGGD